MPWKVIASSRFFQSIRVSPPVELAPWNVGLRPDTPWATPPRDGAQAGRDASPAAVSRVEHAARFPAAMTPRSDGFAAASPYAPASHYAPSLRRLRLAARTVFCGCDRCVPDSSSYKTSQSRKRMALNLGGSTINVGWVRHVVCAVTHQTCRQALIKKCVVLRRNAWWVTQKTLPHPTFRLK